MTKRDIKKVFENEIELYMDAIKTEQNVSAAVRLYDRALGAVTLASDILSITQYQADDYRKRLLDSILKLELKLRA